MALSRRDFMQRGSLAVLAAGASLGVSNPALGKSAPVESSTSPQRYDPLTYFKKSTFMTYRNTTFRITPKGSKQVQAKLVSVEDIGPVPDRPVPGRECFMLKFRGPQSLATGTYKLEHDVLGRFNLMLVPGGKDKNGFYYQAVINRLNS
jgi:hypothetical protein